MIKLNLHLTQRKPALSSESAFPDCCNAPARFQQRRCGPCVVQCIAVYLLTPEVLSRGGPAEQMAVVPMPETTMYEDNCPVSGKDKVGLSGEVLRMQAVAQAGRVECLADQ